MCSYICIIQTLYRLIRTIYVHIRLCTYRILGCCINFPYTYNIRTYFQDIYRRYTNVYGHRWPFVCCSYTFVCAFVCVRMCSYICIIQTLYRHIRTIYVHIRLCTYVILGCCIVIPYTYVYCTYRRTYTYVSCSYMNRLYRHIRTVVFYTNAQGWANIRTIRTQPYVFVYDRIIQTHTNVQDDWWCQSPW
jgi:hypothetical protein